MTRGLLIAIAAALLGGCAAQVQVPDKLQVTDVSSGKTFTTYPNLSKENMLGFNFPDIDSGDWVMLKSYQTRVVQKGGTYPKASPEAIEYEYNVKRLVRAMDSQGR